MLHILTRFFWCAAFSLNASWVPDIMYFLSSSRISESNVSHFRLGSRHADTVLQQLNWQSQIFKLDCSRICSECVNSSCGISTPTSISGCDKVMRLKKLWKLHHSCNLTYSWFIFSRLGVQLKVKRRSQTHVTLY